MELDKRSHGGGEGCLVGIVRIPVKIVAVLVVLPVRVVWELLVALVRAARRYVLGPLYVHAIEPVLRALGRVVAIVFRLLFVWPWVALWRYLLAPVGAALYTYLLSPAGRALYRYLLRPVGLALAWITTVTWRYVLLPVGLGLYRYLLRPVGLALAWLAGGLWRYVLTPLGQLLVWAWYVAGRITGALWRGFKWAGWVLVGWPASRVYRHVLTPAGHVVRSVWRTARAAVREARAEIGRALFGTPAGEPVRSRARTLGSKTPSGDTPAPESSLHTRQG